MGSQQILNVLLVIVGANYIFTQLLDWLNFKHSKADLPAEAEGIFDEERYNKSQRYHKDVVRFSFVTSAFSFILTFGFLLFGGFGWLDGLLSPYVSEPILKALLYFGILFIVTDLINIPFQLYSTFVIEERYGFNKTTMKTFVVDKLKGYVLGAVLGGLIAGILLYLITNIGSSFWIYFWLIITAFMIIMNLFYTSLILPIFNKLTPLDEGELRDAIEAYSKKVKFPLTNIFVIDGSKRSSKANAFFSGIGKKKKVVLYDTLIENHTVEEVVAIFAHEVGHYKHKHIISSMILSVLQSGLMLYLLSMMVFNGILSEALGAAEMQIHLNLIAFGMLYTPISMITGLFMNMLSRKNEYEADRFAVNSVGGNALAAALKKLSADNLSNLIPHPAYVFVHYSHPPLLKRLAAMRN
jgi:STE24 endopeptidase